MDAIDAADPETADSGQETQQPVPHERLGRHQMAEAVSIVLSTVAVAPSALPRLLSTSPLATSASSSSSSSASFVCVVSC